MSSSSSESVISIADNDNQNQLPASSREKYMKAYDNFVLWKNEKGLNNFSQEVLMTYFEELSKCKQPSTLWSTYSMLKATLNANNDIKIEGYKKLTAFLRETAKGHKSKKSKVFSSANVETFIKEADDFDYLVMKVALIFGVQGACRGSELLQLKFEDVERHSDQLLLVKLNDTKHGIDRSFVICGEYKDIVEKYMALRPADAGTDRFFIRYYQGRCFRQVIGKNKISSMPQEIATVLNLPEPKLYTGHCFRRTAGFLSGAFRAELSDLRLHKRKNSGAEYIEMNTVGEINITDPQSDITVENGAKLHNSILDNIKVEVAHSSPTWSTSSSPLPPTAEQQEREPSPPPRKKERTEESGRIKITQKINNSLENKVISIPNKNITITFENCTNVSNININF